MDEYDAGWESGLVTGKESRDEEVGELQSRINALELQLAQAISDVQTERGNVDRLYERSIGYMRERYALEFRLAAAEKDAKRYRWLEKYMTRTMADVANKISGHTDENHIPLQIAIDTAMGKQPVNSGGES